MRQSIKAALLSGLVFPGAGHASLKRYQRGLVFFTPAMVALLYLVRHAMEQAYSIVDKIEQGVVPLDANAISALIAAPPDDATQLILTLASWAITVCWIAGIVDSYRLGRIADRTKQPDSK